MGKPKKEKKSHAKSQLEYEERQKKILGKERYLAKRAKQRAASRARCWARFTEDDKEAKRANQRLRAYKYRHPQANNVNTHEAPQPPIPGPSNSPTNESNHRQVK